MGEFTTLPLLIKRGLKMINISKQEALYLASKGCKWQSDLHKTYSNNPHYFATTDINVMKLLNAYRKNQIVKTVVDNGRKR